MLISTQFQTIARAGAGDGAHEAAGASAKTNEIPGVNMNAANKEKNQLPNRKSEFPKLLIEEDNLQGKKIEMEKKKAEGKLQTGQRLRHIQPREVLKFASFTMFLIICTFLQLDIPQCYSVNYAIRAWSTNSTFSHGSRGAVTLDEIKYANDFYDWLDAFLLDKIYNDMYYEGRSIPEYRQLALPGNNMLISPVRMTQRKIKLTPNTDDLTKKQIPEKWTSTQTNIDY